MVMKQLYINGVGTGQFDIFISSDTFLNSPEIAYEAYEVPSLDGSLLKYDKRLNNVARRFDCFCKTNVQANIEAFKKMLYSQRGYMRIESDYEPDMYQFGYLAEGIEFEPFDASGAFEVKFSVYFSCKPQKFYNTTSTDKAEGALLKFSDVFTRNSELMQKVFNAIPVGDVPDDNLFAYWYVTTPITAQTLTNLTATNANGGFVCLYYDSIYNTDTIIGYGTHGSVSVATFVASSGNVMLITSLVPVGNITASVTLADSSTQTLSANIDNYKTELTNQNAMGGKLTFSLRYRVNGSLPITASAFSIVGMYDGQIQSECVGSIDFASMPQTLLDYLASISDSNGCVIVDFGDGLKATVTDGDNITDLSNYMTISGDISDMCDTFDLYSISESYMNIGSITHTYLNVDWWVL